MLIHSVTPAQLLIEQPQSLQPSTLRIDGGILEGYETPGGFQTQRLLSTDPAMYLRAEYAPGQIYKAK